MAVWTQTAAQVQHFGQVLSQFQATLFKPQSTVTLHNGTQLVGRTVGGSVGNNAAHNTLPIATSWYGDVKLDIGAGVLTIDFMAIQSIV